jgi:hypothetical protein
MIINGDVGGLLDFLIFFLSFELHRFVCLADIAVHL